MEAKLGTEISQCTYTELFVFIRQALISLQVDSQTDSESHSDLGSPVPLVRSYPLHIFCLNLISMHNRFFFLGEG